MRILLVEDDLALAAGMEAALQRHGHALTVSQDGATALALLADPVFDLVLLDIGLPDLDGLTVLQRLRQIDRRLPVILITARDAIDDRIRGLDAGADDYLVKPVALDELAARIRVVSRRARLAHSTQLEHGPLTLDCDAQRAWLQGQALDLTPREWRALETLLRRVERVVSKQQLLESFATSPDDVAYNAAEVYVSRLRGKLEPAGIHIRTVRGFGYMLEEFKGGAAA